MIPYMKRFCCLVVLSLLTACADPLTLGGRLETAQNIASQGGLQPLTVQTLHYNIATWQKISQAGAPLHVYIEGDGQAWVSRSTPSRNPTPTDPIALTLASLDPAPNIVYLARPCQYTPLEQSPACTVRSWTSQRFSEEIIQGMDTALSRITQGLQNPALDLIGFSGGGNIALLLAARRSDIASVRTVAGNIDITAFNALHHTSPMPDSLNSADFADRLKTIPQRHFIGVQDDIVPPVIYQSYAKALNSAPCLKLTLVPAATHTEGWESVWPALLKESVSCETK